MTTNDITEVVNCSCGTPHGLGTTCDEAAWRVTNDARHMRMVLELIADTPTSKKHREAARAALVKTKNAPWVMR